MFDALDAIEAMDDPVARARAASQLLKDQPQRNARLRAARDEVVLQLRHREGLSLRKIAAQVGVSLGTVQDILRGHTGTWSSRPKKQTPAEESPNE